MLLQAAPRILCIVDNNRGAIRAWIEGVMASTKLSATQLAQKAGVHQTTLTRFLNDPKFKHTPSLSTVGKIAAAVGIEPFADPARISQRGAMSSEGMLGWDTESRRYADVTVAARALLASRKGLEAWTLKTRALEAAGYDEGDVVIFDYNQPARAGDIVCATHHQRRGDPEDMIFRVFEPPYLMPAPGDRGRQRPLMVDDDMVIVRGPIVVILKPRRCL